MKQEKKPVSIIGSGISALVLALAALRQGWQVNLYASTRKRMAAAYDLRAYAVNANSQTLLKGIELWPLLARDAMVAIHAMQLCSLQHHARIDATRVRADTLGWVVRAQELEDAAWKLIKAQQGVSHFTLLQQRVIKLQPIEQGFSLCCEDGSIFQASCLVLAEGKNAELAEQLGFACTHLDYQSLAHVANLAIDGSHHHTAWQFFFDDRIVALLPLCIEGREQYALICSQKGGPAFDENQLAEVLNSLPSSTGLCKPTAFLTPLQTWPLHNLKRTPVAQNNCYLIGDALRTVHPLAGQGFNLACADINAWLRAHASNTSHPMLAQRRYAAQVFWASAGLQTLIDGIARTKNFESTLACLPDQHFDKQPPWLNLQRLAYRVASGIPIIT